MNAEDSKSADKPGNEQAAAAHVDIIDRKRTEHALQESEARFRAIVENSYDGIIFTDERGLVLYRSPSCRLINGYTDEERIGQDGFEMIHAEDLAAVHQVWTAVLNHPEMLHKMSYRIRHKDGSWRSVESSVQYLLGNPCVKAVVLTTRDITDRTVAVAQLQATAERLRAILQRAPLGIVITDLEGRLLEYNPAHERMCGYTSEELKGTNFLQYTHPDDVAKNLELFKQVTNGAVPSVEIEKRVVRKDGQVIWVRVISSRLKKDSTIGIVENVTTRKEAEQQLRATADRLQAILEHAPVGIVIADRTNRLEETNTTFQRMTGYSAAELRHMQWRELIHPDDVAGDAAAVDGLMGGELRSYDFEKRCLLKSGKTIWVRVVGSRLDEDHKIAIIEDITERKESVVKTRQLEEQLRQSQKLESLGRLAGGVAHDFNNLLMVISSYGEMLQERVELNEKGRNYTRQILNASARAAALSRQLLAFSRKQVLAPRILDLNTTIQESTKMIKRLIGEDIELRFRPDKLLAHIAADPNQITQVLLNLCVNARDAMPRGGTISIATENAEVDASIVSHHQGLPVGKYVILTVTDTGEGMTQEIQEHIFEPFFTTKPIGQGTGLGLSTVYGIVKQSNGYIWACSEPGWGTSFKLCFPATDKNLAPVKATSSHKNEGRGETILVVEDEEALKRVVCEHLQRHGYNVLEACDGETALELAENHPGPLHVLLTDVIMPKMNGPELVTKLASLPNRHNVPIVYMSGYEGYGIVSRDVLQPGQFWMQKPFSLAALTEMIAEVLGEHN